MPIDYENFPPSGYGSWEQFRERKQSLKHIITFVDTTSQKEAEKWTATCAEIDHINYENITSREAVSYEVKRSDVANG